MVYIYNGIVLSHKKEWNLASCDNMDRHMEGYYAKCNKSKKNKCLMISLTCGI